MSGIEIAGLVLGAVPLIVVAMEKYSEAAKMYDSFKKHRTHLISACRRLKAEQRVYQNTYMTLLSGIIPRHEIARIVQKGPKQTSNWKRQEFENILQKRLARDYEVFSGLMEEMNFIVREFAKELNLDEDFQVQAEHRSGFRMRMKFVRHKPKYLDLVETMHRLNETLQSLSNYHLNSDQGSDKDWPDVEGILRIRKYASTLHSLLRACFNCPCCTEHTASIRLDTPREDLFRVSTSGMIAPSFSFLLSFSTEQSSLWSTSTPWTTKTVKISGSKQPLNGVVSRSPTTKANGVKFGFCLPINELAPGACGPPGSSKVSWRMLELCDTFCDPPQRQNKTYSGHLIDECNHSHGQFALDLPEKELQPLSVAYLQSLLETGAAFSGPGLTVEKMQLAMEVAHRVMELHDTPWLDSDWGKHHVVFLQTLDGPKFDSSYMLSNSLGSLTPATPYPWTHLQPRNRAIFGLGVVLVEIGLGVPFDEAIKLTKSQKRDGPDLANPWDAIVEVVKKVYEETDKNYGEAVERCLFCDFGQLHVGFDRDDFYGIFYSKVVSRPQRTNYYLSMF
ncbi:hypothetical protein HDK90DRAFT_15116 [Phyllosticta capitalensis]|uniref:DUF7580 domain-containing protein n=1 Tax=Phyllosticta capitalensis TaxID=121624 RepID=A0ABR1Z321_9PEZI